MRRLVLAVAVVAIAAGVGGALILWGGGASDERPGEWGPTQAGVCAALDAAEAGDQRRARSLFVDRAHEGLHVLAAAADRAEAARLLEAKHAVEAELADGPAGTGLAADLAELSRRTQAAAVTVGPDPGPC